MKVIVTRAGGKTETHECVSGEIWHLPLAEGERARLVVEPARRFDVGMGRGGRVETEVVGGCCGLILDARGRPLPFADEPAANAALRRRDYEALGLKVQ
jgi:hypothetical protein